HLDAALGIHELLRGRVGLHLEERCARLHEAADLGELPLNDTGKLRFDADLDARLDGADGEGLIDDVAARDLDRRNLPILRAIVVGDHRSCCAGYCNENDQGEDDLRSALHEGSMESRSATDTNALRMRRK